MNVPGWVYTIAWSLWIAWFVVFETLALIDRSPGDTLTEHVRPLIQATAVGWVLGTLFFVWLLVHFIIER